MASIFTRIIAGELPANFVWKDDLCVAFLSNRPLRPGHTLVVPRLETDHWLALEPALLTHLATTAQTIGKAQMTEIFAPGELERIGQWLRKLHPNGGASPAAVADPLSDCINYVLQFPPSQLRGIDLQLRRNDSSTFPATLYLSAIRDAQGKPSGILAVGPWTWLPANGRRDPCFSPSLATA